MRFNRKQLIQYLLRLLISRSHLAHHLKITYSIFILTVNFIRTQNELTIYFILNLTNYLYFIKLILFFGEELVFRCDKKI